MTAQNDTDLTALRQALALAQQIGSAASYADLIDCAVRAFDDGAVHSLLLFVYEGDQPGALDYARVAAAWRRGQAQHPARGQRFDLAQMPFARASVREIQALGDIEADERIDPATKAVLRQQGVRASLSIPLLQRGELIGTVYMSWPAPHQFAPTTIQLAETLMSLGPGVVERIRLYEESRAQLAQLDALRAGLEAQVAERTGELRSFQAIVDGALDAMAIATPQGVLIYGNRAFAELSGFGERVVGSAIPDYFAPEDLPVATGEMLPALFKEGSWRGTLRMRRPDGSFWTSELNAFALRDDHGRTETLAGIFRDITAERVRAEALLQANERLEQSFRTSPLATLEADNQGIIRRWNPAAEKIFGWPADEAIGRNAIELLVPGLAREQVEYVVGALLSGHATNSRNVNITKDGREITCQWYNAVLRDPNGAVTGWLSQTEDVTEQLRAEAERAAMAEQVIAAQQAALRELSTPIIPIGEGVVALPLIGSIDSARAQQVIEALLEGVGERRARTAILDITGVPVVDTQVADALLRAAQAVKLLGARVVLTGIRPEVAQTLVGLGLDLSGITTLGTLQSGIAFALARAGRQ